MFIAISTSITISNADSADTWQWNVQHVELLDESIFGTSVSVGFWNEQKEARQIGVSMVYVLYIMYYMYVIRIHNIHIHNIHINMCARK